MGSLERRSRQRDELRSSILGAARELFLRDGFEAVTMRRIAEAIEYSPTAIYLHFKDKDALLSELCSRDFVALSDAIRHAAGALTGGARLKAIAQAYVSFSVAHPGQYRLLFMTPKPATDPGSPPATANHLAYQALREVFVQLGSSDQLRSGLTDFDLLAQVYLCGLHGIVAAAIAPAAQGQHWHSPSEQATLFVDSLINGIAKGR